MSNVSSTLKTYKLNSTKTCLYRFGKMEWYFLLQCTCVEPVYKIGVSYSNTNCNFWILSTEFKDKDLVIGDLDLKLWP